MRKVSLLFLALFLSSSLGCATYLKDRGADALDMFHVKVSIGPGLFAGARATQSFSMGLGVLNNVQKYGIKGRGIGHWEEYRGEAGVMFMGLPISFQYLKEVNKTFVSGNEYLRKDLEEPNLDDYRVFPLLGLAWWPLKEENAIIKGAADRLSSANPLVADRKLTEIGLSLHLLIIGADVGIDLLEVFDFVLGWATLDFRGDDSNSIIRRFKDKQRGKDQLENQQAKK